MTPSDQAIAFIREHADALRAAGRWFLLADVVADPPPIRCELEDKHLACPLTALHPGAPVPLTGKGGVNAFDVADRLKLDTKAARRIVSAADGWRAHDPAVREAIVEATGCCSDAA